jgi:hypothetical protein
LVFHIAAHGTRVDPNKIVRRVDAGTGPGTGTGACAGVALDVSASAEEDLAEMKLCNGLFVEETTCNTQKAKSDGVSVYILPYLIRFILKWLYNTYESV